MEKIKVDARLYDEDGILVRTEDFFEHIMFLESNEKEIFDDICLSMEEEGYIEDGLMECLLNRIDHRGWLANIALDEEDFKKFHSKYKEHINKEEFLKKC